MDPMTRAVRETSLPAIVARAAERLIAGTIVYVIDIRIDDGPGGRVDLDIVPDTVGMAFIVWGLATLRRRSLTPAYDRLVQQCYLVAAWASRRRSSTSSPKRRCHVVWRPCSPRSRSVASTC